MNSRGCVPGGERRTEEGECSEPEVGSGLAVPGRWGKGSGELWRILVQGEDRSIMVS